MQTDRDHLLSAARLALRGHGRAEPNPLVGCVIVSQSDEVVGWGYHEQFGGPHAEIHALRRAGARARGATVYVTLEPCNHTGKTGPCSHALIDAGVARVVAARSDPHPEAAGGLESLRAAGIEVCVTDVCPEARAVSDAFVHRVRTGLPWVTVKWAQTIDGRIATRTGESKWISNEASRKLVHRKRGRVDAIVTGIGTVLRDDPMLTARDVRVRRVARRVVIDPELKIPLDSALVRSAKEVPTTVVCVETSADDRSSADGRSAIGDRYEKLMEAGVEVIAILAADHELPLDSVLRELVTRHDVTNVLVEAGPGLMSRLFRQNLVNEAWVFVAGMLLGDEEAMPSVRGFAREGLLDATAMRLMGVRRYASDVLLRYRL